MYKLSALKQNHCSVYVWRLYQMVLCVIETRRTGVCLC